MMPAVQIICAWCKKEFTVAFKERKRRFCSPACSNCQMREDRRGSGLPAWLRTEEARAALRKAVSSPEYRAGVSARFAGTKQTTPNLAEFSPTHIRAAKAVFRDPNNKTHSVSNIVGFVYSNQHLFAEQDVVRFASARRKFMCRAASGLSAVYSGRVGSWKGWTLVSATEVFYNKGQHPLAQEALS